MEKEFNITAGVTRSTEKGLIPFVASMLKSYKHVSVSWNPKDDSEHPYKVSYRYPKLTKITK